MLKQIAVAALVLAAASAAQAAQVGFNISKTDVDAERKSSSASTDYDVTEYGFSWATTRGTSGFHFRGAANLLDGDFGSTEIEGYTGSFVFAFGQPQLKKGPGGGFWFGPALYVGDLEGKDVDTDLAYFGPGFAAGIDIPTSGGALSLEAAFRKLDATQDFANGSDQDFDIDGVQLRASLLFGK